MNKVLAIGIIVVVVIGIILVSYNNLPNTNTVTVIPEKPANTTNKHYSIELKESEGITQRP